MSLRRYQHGRPQRPLSRDQLHERLIVTSGCVPSRGYIGSLRSRLLRQRGSVSLVNHHLQVNSKGSSNMSTYYRLKEVQVLGAGWADCSDECSVRDGSQAYAHHLNAPR